MPELIDWHKSFGELNEDDKDKGIFIKIIYSLKCYNCGVVTPLLEEKQGSKNGNLVYCFPTTIFKNCQFCNYELVI